MVSRVARMRPPIGEPDGEGVGVSFRKSTAKCFSSRPRVGGQTTVQEIPVVAIRLDEEEPNWEKTALRCLKAGATLYGVPEDRAEALMQRTKDNGLHLTRTETPDGWRVSASASGSSSSDPAPSSPPSEEAESSTRTRMEARSGRLLPPR